MSPIGEWAESLSFVDWYSLYNKNTCSLSCMDRELLYAAAILGSWVPVECHMFSGHFSMREVEFHRTFWISGAS